MGSVAPEHEIVVATEQSVSLFRTDDPVEIVGKAQAIANALADVIRKQKLASTIQGKEYVRVEGWTLLGSMLGVYPVCVWTKETDDGWEARAEARTRDGSIIGSAEASCSREEKRWATADTYAIRSMAQTRATSKCLRMPLGFVMNLAGYEVTPAEEIPREGFSPAKPAAAKKPRKLTPDEQAVQDKAREAISDMEFTQAQVEDFKHWAKRNRLRWVDYVIAAAENGVKDHEEFTEWVGKFAQEPEPKEESVVDAEFNELE